MSTKEQAEEGGSLESQKNICLDYALKNGFEVAEIYIEKGESAKTANRTELNKLLSYCSNKKNNIHGVIAYKIDRVARNIDDYREIRLLLKRYGVEIKSTTEFFEDNPAGRFMENIIANVAQFDNDVRTERSVNGSRDAMREGRYVWCAPFGYSNAKIGLKSNIVQNDKAAIIRKVFIEIAKNEQPIDSIRMRMHKEGLTTKSGGIFPKSHYYRLLTNPVYAGWIVKFGERHQGVFEPIVSQELFDQVQRVLKGRKRLTHGYLVDNPDFPLRRFVRNRNGKKITGSWSQGRSAKYPYYTFIGAKKGNIKKEKLEQLYGSYIERYTLQESYFAQFKQSIQVAIDKTNATGYKQAEKLRAEIQALNERQSAMIVKNERGIISDAILQKQLEAIENSIQDKTAELYKLPEKQDDIAELLEFAEKYLTNPKAIWENANLKQKVQLQWFEFPEGVTFHNDKFRTTEIASIFKVKDIFLPALSLSVRDKGQIFEPLLDYDTVKKIPLQQWFKYLQEIRTLTEILKGNK